MKSCRIWRLSVRLYVRPYVRLFPPSGPQAWLAGPEAWLDGPERGTGGRKDGRTYIRRENVPILHGAAVLLPKESSRPIKSRAREPLTI